MQSVLASLAPPRSPMMGRSRAYNDNDPTVFDVRGAPSITVREATARMQGAQSDALLLDVREVYEYVPRHPTGAVNIPMSQLQRRVGEVPKDREVLVICEHGNRSVNVTCFLARKVSREPSMLTADRGMGAGAAANGVRQS